IPPAIFFYYSTLFDSRFKTLQQNPFQYTVQGNSHNRLKSTNLIERLNQEVRRREKIIRIFPNQTSANRLIGAVLMDLHDEWIYSSRKYINFDK
ncbi:TPA: transposase, partial [Enterococcus faecium]